VSTPVLARRERDRGPAVTQAAVSRPDRLRRYNSLLHAATLLGGLLLLLFFNRRDYFFADEWDFVLRRGLTHAELGLFTPHNEHWSTIPILVFRTVFHFAGARSYLPYLLPMLALHLAVAHLIWRTMLRVGVGPLLSTTLVGMFVVLGAGYQHLLWAFQVSQSGSLFFGWAMIMVVDRERPSWRSDALGWLFGVLSLLCSGVGVPMVLAAALLVAFRSGLRPAVRCASVPALVYLSWYVAVGHSGYNGQNGGGGFLDSLAALPHLTWVGLTHVFEATFGVAGLGGVLVVALAGYLLRGQRRMREGGVQAVVVATALTTIAFYALVVSGRTALGEQGATASRYLYIAVALLLPAIGLALTELDNWLHVPWSVAAGVVILLAVYNVGELRSYAATNYTVQPAVQRRVIAAAQLARTQPVIAALVEPTYDPDISIQALRRLDRAGDLPAGPPATPAELLEAARYLQVSLTEAPLYAPSAAPRLVRFAGLPGAAGDPGCVTFDPAGTTTRLYLAVPSGGGSLSVTSEAGGSMQVTLNPGASSPLGSERPLALAASRTEWLNIATAEGTPTLTLPAQSGQVRVCGLPGAQAAVRSSTGSVAVQ